MRTYVFRLHFNRLNMQRGDPRVWTVHWRGQCIQVEKVVSHVQMTTRFTPGGRQPRAVLVGRAAHCFTGSAVAILT